MRVIWLTGVWGREEVPASLFAMVPRLDGGSMALGLVNWNTLQGFWRVLMAEEAPPERGLVVPGLDLPSTQERRPRGF